MIEWMVDEVVGKDMRSHMSRVIDSLASQVLDFSTCVTKMVIQDMLVEDRQRFHLIVSLRLGERCIEGEELMGLKKSLLAESSD
jgi:hypothetical protein